jgi:hypothetical protein
MVQIVMEILLDEIDWIPGESPTSFDDVSARRIARRIVKALLVDAKSSLPR